VTAASTPPPKILASDWIVPISSPPVADGAVVVVAGRVAWIGPADDLPLPWREVPVEHHRGVMLPGLVNAHSHLQYTHFAEVGRGAYSSFEEWAEAFEIVYLNVDDPSYWRESADAGARMAVQSGTTCIGDVVTDAEALGAQFHHGLTGIDFLEVLGQTQQLWDEGERARFLDLLDGLDRSGYGISPHAPYSVDAGVIADLVALASERGMRLHSHVAESAVEEALYQSGDAHVLDVYGDLRDEFALVRDGGVGQATIPYTFGLGLLGATTHIAHGIYIDREGRDLLRTCGTAVALCPRSNDIIGIGPAPVADYLREGHEIAIGTDSLASSPSLDLMDDVAALARLAFDQGYRSDDLSTRLLRAATLGGAKALGLHRGVIEAGVRADLALFAIEVDGENVADAVVVQGAGRCVLTLSGGSVIHAR
jgi:aminodeoxyfutalosine deaminase